MAHLLYRSTSYSETPFIPLPTTPKKFKLQSKDSLSPACLSKYSDFLSYNGSLNDLEGACVAYHAGRDSGVYSLASTNEGSHFGFDSRTITRMQSLDPEGSLVAEEDNRMTKLNLAAKILEDDAESEIHTEMSFELDLTEISEISPFKTPSEAAVSYWCVCPTFEKPKDEKSSDYFIVNDGNTLVGNNNKKFSTVYANNPLPKTGRTKFSVKIDKSMSLNPRIYVGIAEGSLKGKSMAYKPGFYFVNGFSGESYLNGLKLLSQDCLLEEGQVISVTVDIEEELVIFEKDDVEILSGKLNVKKSGKKEFYPCVAIGEKEGEVSFVWDY